MRQAVIDAVLYPGGDHEREKGRHQVTVGDQRGRRTSPDYAGSVPKRRSKECSLPTERRPGHAAGTA